MRPGHLLLALVLGAAALSAGCFEIDLILGSAEAGICTTVPLDSVGVDRDHCIQDAAIRKSDAELCADIERPPPESKCHMLIAEKEMDPAYCDRMKDNPGPTGEYSRLECLQRVAIAAADPSVCEQMGSSRSSSMFSGTFSKEDCLTAVGTGKGVTDYYHENTDRYVYCQDLAYTEIFRKPPDSLENLGPAARAYAGGQRKAEVGEKLLDGYVVGSRGYVEKGQAPQVTLQDGDIIVFGFDAAPDPKNAPHYAVAQDGKVLQVLSFPQGGVLDEPREIAWFFDTRTVTNPATGTTSTSPRVYQYYTVYQKKN